MDKQQFMEFMSHFIIVRPGMYDVPDSVLAATFDTFCENASLEPLLTYERVTYFSWHASQPPPAPNDLMRQRLFDQADLDWMHGFLNGETCLKPEDAFSEKTLQTIRSFLNSGLLTTEAYEQHLQSYPVRRQKACAAIASTKTRSAVLKRDGHKCRRCRSTKNLSVDHIVAVYNGGDNSLDNLQTLCRSCNSSKGHR